MTQPVILQAVNAAFPQLNTQLVNSDGTISFAWYRFLQQLWTRTGSGPGVNSAELAELALSQVYANAGLLGRVANLEGEGLPVGSIILWAFDAASIPKGWAVCNGLGGTVDLRDRFVVGAGGTYAPGATGGAASVTISVAQLPAHNHPVIDPGHVHAGGVTAANLAGASAGGLQTGNTGSAVTGITTGNTGSGNPVPILPPYFAALYIQKVS
jgi:microcystin-dependent protein